MKSNLAIALCLIIMAGCFGMAMAENPDTTQTAVGDQDGFFSTDSGGLEEGEAAAPAPVQRSGQTICYGARDDGKLRKGVVWPRPRFKNNGNGTVTDNLTGLIWLRNANCSVFYAGDATGHNNRDWKGALTAANKLKNGACGLTDGSLAGDWRLPNMKELQSLIDFGFDGPALPNTLGTGKWIEGNPFTGVQSGCDWSSTTRAFDSEYALVVGFRDGYVCYAIKTDAYFVWPVRGGQ
jgi:hypothetical protein